MLISAGQGSAISAQYSTLSRPTSTLIDVCPTNLLNAFSNSENGEQSQIEVQCRNDILRTPILDTAAANRISPTTVRQFTNPDDVLSRTNRDKGDQF